MRGTAQCHPPLYHQSNGEKHPHCVWTWRICHGWLPQQGKSSKLLSVWFQWGLVKCPVSWWEQIIGQLWQSTAGGFWRAEDALHWQYTGQYNDIPSWEVQWPNRAHLLHNITAWIYHPCWVGGMEDGQPHPWDWWIDALQQLSGSVHSQAQMVEEERVPALLTVSFWMCQHLRLLPDLLWP